MAKVTFSDTGFSPITLTLETPEEALLLLAHLNPPTSEVTPFYDAHKTNCVGRPDVPDDPFYSAWVAIKEELKRRGYYKN